MYAGYNLDAATHSAEGSNVAPSLLVPFLGMFCFFSSRAQSAVLQHIAMQGHDTLTTISEKVQGISRLTDEWNR